MRVTADVARDVGQVIFDCDGVLVDSERLNMAVEARMLTEMGWPITVDELVRQFVGGSSDTTLAEIERHLGTALTAEFERRSTEEIIAAFHAELTGLRPLFEGRIYSGSEVERGKPWPDLFLHAARSMGMEPNRCVVIEDPASAGWSIRRGRSPGVRCSTGRVGRSRPRGHGTLSAA